MGNATATLTVRAPERWQRRLDELAALHGVPGAQLAVRRISDNASAHGPIEVATTGVLNLSTGVTTAAESLFEIGSVTKVWTTVLLMQLVDDGLLDLDAPVVSVLPGFTLRDSEAASRITVRHLLCHTSGIDGDLFIDTGRGDDAVERYVDGLRNARIIHPIGGRFSYCNSGFVIAGRIIEVLRGADWDTVLREKLIEPLGLQRTVTLPEHAVAHTAAIGHNDRLEPLRAWGVPRAMGPAGSIASSVSDLVVFATAMECHGLAENGRRILSAESARRMREHQADLPREVARFTGWGLGWFLEQWGNQDVYGHDGGTVGQRAFLRVLPESGIIVSLLTNTTVPSSALYLDLLHELTAEWGVGTPPRFDPVSDYRADPAELEAYAGTYSTDAMDVRVEVSGNGLSMASREKLSLDPDANTGKFGEPVTLVPLAKSRFAYRTSPSGVWDEAAFPSTPEATYLHLAHRLLPKVASPAR